MASRGRRPRAQPVPITHLTELEILDAIWRAIPAGMTIAPNGRSVHKLVWESLRSAEQAKAD